MQSKDDQQSLKKWTNTALAELWKPTYTEIFSKEKLMARAETYGPDDLPNDIKVITGFCDVQGDRLEVQLVGWGLEEESWPFQYDIIHQDPAQPSAWKELDQLLQSKFCVRGSDRILRIAAFGIDMGGNHTGQVLSYCKARRGRRVFACKGRAGTLPIWPGRESQSKSKDIFYSIGVDTAKDAIYSRLNIEQPEPGFRKPGFIHFPVGENFGHEYYDQLNSERRERRLRMGQAYTVWVQIRDRNEVLDTMVGALAMRKSLPRVIQAGLEYKVAPDEGADNVLKSPSPEQENQTGMVTEGAALHEAFTNAMKPAQSNWVRNGRGKKNWFDRS